FSRPSASVKPLATITHPSRSICGSRGGAIWGPWLRTTATPVAGRPLVVSRMCVEIPISRPVSANQFHQAQFRDLHLLSGGDAQFFVGSILQTDRKSTRL